MTARLSATVVAAAAAAAVGLVTGHLLPGHLSPPPKTTIADVCPLVKKVAHTRVPNVGFLS